MTRRMICLFLNQAFDNFQMVTQCLPNSLDTANNYDSKTVAIIDILEEELYGARRAAFKRGYVPKYTPCGSNLYDRFYFIVKEGKFEKDIRKVCYFDVDSMYHYFRQLSELRESFNVK